jgi:hypothetical protein
MIFSDFRWLADEPAQFFEVSISRGGSSASHRKSEPYFFELGAGG